MGSDRLPYLGIRKREMKIRRHDACHEIASIIHDEAGSQCFLRSSELLLPQLVTQHCHPFAALLFFGSKDAAEQGLHAKQRPKVRRHAGRTHSFRRPVGPKQKCLSHKSGHVFKTAVLASPIREIEKRDPAFMKFARRIAGKHHGEPAGIFVGEGPQQNGLDNAENCGIRPYTKCQREDDYHAKARPPLHLAQGLTQFAAQVVKEHPVAMLVPPLLGSRDVTERSPGGGIRIGARSGIANFVCLDRQMGFDLFLEILEGSFLPPPHAQASDSPALRMRAIAPAIFLHSAVLSVRRLRPLAVSL